MIKSEPEIVVDVAAQDETVPLTADQQSYLDPMGTGFLWYAPRSDINQEQSGRQWTISGHDMQVLTTTVEPGEAIITEIGTFFYGSGGIKTDVELTCCAEGCQKGYDRICGGESCVKLLLRNESSEQGYVGLTPNFPAKIIPIKFGSHVHEDHALIAQSGQYMAQIGDVDVGCSMDCSLHTCCCGGMGLCRQKLTGPKDSIAFLAAGGTLLYKNLQDGETVTVDSNSVVAMEETVQMGIVSNGRFCMICCGGEGCCSTTLTGPGKVFMQSMSFNKFKDAVTQTVIERDESGGGDGE